MKMKNIQKFALIALSTSCISSLIALASPPMQNALGSVQVLALLVRGAPGQRISSLVEQRAIGFKPSTDFTRILQAAGAEETLLKALRRSTPLRSRTANPSDSAKKGQIVQHLARSAELTHQGPYKEAAQDVRPVIELDPADAGLHLGLAYILGRQETWDKATAEDARPRG